MWMQSDNRFGRRVRQWALSMTIALCGGGVAGAQVGATPAPAVTPEQLPHTEAFLYRTDPVALRLFVAKPDDWEASDRRPAYVFFFGGGFVRGTPERSINTARTLTRHGFVGIAPDYRTAERFGTTGIECIADARAVIRWIQDHADQLGIDPARIVVGGSSAGGSLALWTAIRKTPPGLPETESPLLPPAALILLSAPVDVASSRRARLFGPHPEHFSPLQNLEPQMPPVLAFHGDADTTVDYQDAVRLEKRMVELGNRIDLITVSGGSHSFRSDLPDWKRRSDDRVITFLRELKLIADEGSANEE
ncbi:MAG TPA: alpha/beta hydrolase [Tepidisphaeraceae bacterium]|nr:alpha/beta hydrolase [Tepidisphaeraceae bacterium]